MKKIAIFVVLAYAAMFCVLTWPVIMAAFAPTVEPVKCFEVFTAWHYWVFVGLCLLCQAGLLTISVRIMSERPIANKHVLVPIITIGFLVGALALGVICSLTEFFLRKPDFDPDWTGWAALAGCAAIWLLWSMVFRRLARGQEPRGFLLRQCRRLLQGSVITLLVAVSTHIVARYRNYCCAGFMTFIGITFGLAVLLLSFGPGIYFLYVERWKKLHPGPAAGEKGS
jgi:hypothetical protein